jgi:hypothetical protein
MPLYLRLRNVDIFVTIERFLVNPEEVSCHASYIQRVPKLNEPNETKGNCIASMCLLTSRGR